MKKKHSFMPRQILSNFILSSEQQCNCAIGKYLLRQNASVDEKMSNKNEKNLNINFSQSRSIKSFIN